jgi:hypothetical protein
MNTPRKALLMTTLLVSTLGWGQQPITFNVAHTNAIGSFAVGKSVYEVADGYLVFSQQKGVLGGLQNPFVTKFDLQGQLVWEREYVHSRYVNYGIVDPVARLAGGGYASGISVFGAGSPIDSLFLFRFDEEGDTLWTRFLLADTTVAIRKCIETANGDLVLTGLYQYPSGAYIYRLTADGDSVVFKNLGAPVFDANSVAESSDGSLYICGISQSDIYDEHSRATLLKVDANGNLIWMRQWPRASYYSQAIPTNDSGVLVVGSYSTLLQQTPIMVWSYTMSYIVKYDANGNMMWYRDGVQVDASGRPSVFYDGLELPNGELVACGLYKSSATLDRGMLFKFTSEGDELWRRFYRWYDGPFNGNPQIFNDVEPTSDGGFILTGSTERFVDTTYTYPAKLWLVKLDSMGCLVPGCHTVGIEEQALDLNQYLRIWPNPVAAGQAVQFSFEPPPTFTLNGPLRVALLDGAGRIVHEERVQVGTGQLANLSLAAGLYYLHLTDGSRWLAGGKVVVE